MQSSGVAGSLEYIKPTWTKMCTGCGQLRVNKMYYAADKVPV